MHPIAAEVGGRPLNLYLFVGDLTVLLDTGHAGTVAEQVLPFLQSIGISARELDLLVISHPDYDHQGGAAALKAANPRLRIASGVADRRLVSDPDALLDGRYRAYERDHGIGYPEDVREWIRNMSGAPVPVDIGLAGGETLRISSNLELTILHTPGHSQGHVTLLDATRRVAYTQDAVQGSVYLGLDGLPKLAPTYTEVAPYLNTIAKLRALALSALYSAHWDDCEAPEDVDRFLTETRDYVRRMDAAVDDAFSTADEAIPLRTLVTRVNERLPDPWDEASAQELVYSLEGHVAARVDAGTLEQTLGADGHVVFELRR